MKNIVPTKAVSVASKQEHAQEEQIELILVPTTNTGLAIQVFTHY